MASSEAARATDVRQSVTKGRAPQGVAWLIIAGTYRSLLSATAEQVQNALDAGAREIRVLIDYKRSLLRVEDNGEGVSAEDFDEKIKNIGVSSKRRVAGKLGRFGRLISLLGKCAVFTFTSSPRKGATAGYREWEFSTERILEGIDAVDIPNHARPELWFSSRKDLPSQKGKSFAWWRSRVEARNFTKDRMTSQFSAQDLADEIAVNYNEALLQHGTVVHITHVSESGVKTELAVKGQEYEGDPIEVARYTDRRCGEVTFTLFRARMNVRKGKALGRVCVGIVRDPFRFSLEKFARAASAHVETDVLDLLKSGLLEGSIVGQFVELDPDRTTFIANDAFKGMCTCLDKWYADVGEGLESQLRVGAREQRVTKVLNRAMGFISELLKDPKWSGFYECLQMGNIGEGHTTRRTYGVLPVRTTPHKGGEKSNPPGASDGRERKGPDDQEEKEKHHPTTIEDPDGSVRNLVRGGSTGLSLARASLRSTKAYMLDLTTGVLTLNTSHPYWAECDTNDSSLMRYVETVVMHAVNNAIHRGETYESVVEESSQRLLGMEVYHIVNGDRLSGRRSVRGKK
jgi:hypothetical protein